MFYFDILSIVRAHIEAEVLHRGPEVKEAIDYLTYGLRQTPEFLAALGEEFFRPTGANGSPIKMDSIKFEKDDQKYEVSFELQDFPDSTIEETFSIRRGNTSLYLQASYTFGEYRYLLGKAVLDDGDRRLEDTDAIIDIRNWFPEFYI